MQKLQIPKLIMAVVASGLLAKAPGALAGGNNTSLHSLVLSADDSCIIDSMDSANDLQMFSDDSGTGNTSEEPGTEGDAVADADATATETVAADSFALASAMASSQMDILWAGEAELELTRNGMYGALSLVELSGSLAAGQVYAIASETAATNESSASTETAAVVASFVQSVADALASDGFKATILLPFIPDPKLELAFSGGATSGAEAAALAGALASAETGSFSLAESGAYAEGAYEAHSGTVVRVQGANIERFEAGMLLESGGVLEVSAASIASATASAFTTAAVYAAANGYAEALAAGEVAFCFENIPLLNDGCISIDDAEVGAAFATALADAAADIQAFAGAYSEAYATTLASAGIELIAQVTFENLPGTQDLLELEASDAVAFTCSDLAAAANAGAESGIAD